MYKVNFRTNLFEKLILLISVIFYSGILVFCLMYSPDISNCIILSVIFLIVLSVNIFKLINKYKTSILITDNSLIYKSILKDVIIDFENVDSYMILNKYRKYLKIYLKEKKTYKFPIYDFCERDLKIELDKSLLNIKK